jgi:ABC-type branched-subunit amino acid transport system substrate-binding protein
MNRSAVNHRSIFFSCSFFLLFLCSPYILHGQNFNQALAYYQNKDYQQAIAILKNLSTERAHLFLGKSYYALGKYQKALENLSHIPPDTLSQIYQEAKYTAALANYQKKEFGKALNKLHEVSQISGGMTGNLSSRAKKLYQQILNYLTANQRQKIITGNYNNGIKFDLLKTALGKIPFKKAADLYQTFTRNVQSNRWQKQLKKVHSNLKNKSTYHSEYGSPSGKLRPPKGTIYHIGIVMPSYKPDNSNYNVVKALYLGALLAADHYNQKHQRTKAFIHFVKSGGSPDGIKNAIQHFKTKHFGEVLIGPLFSGQLQAMDSLTSEYRIPAIAPLANKNVNLDSSWLYQANPTYKVQGKAMAKFAVNNLGIYRFTIIADKNSSGAIAARAFRDEAEKLDADINHYFVRNLGSSYEFSKYTRYLGASTPPINAVYAPLNGSNALALIDLLLRKVRTLHHHVTVLGAQEWKKHRYDQNNNENVDIYYSESLQSTDNRLEQFKYDYQNKFNTTGNEYSVIGYDVTRFILKTLQKIGNPDLLQSAIANQPRYYGLARNIYFGGTHVNQAVHIVQASSQ